MVSKSCARFVQIRVRLGFFSSSEFQSYTAVFRIEWNRIIFIYPPSIRFTKALFTRVFRRLDWISWQVRYAVQGHASSVRAQSRGPVT